MWESVALRVGNALRGVLAVHTGEFDIPLDAGMRVAGVHPREEQGACCRSLVVSLAKATSRRQTTVVLAEVDVHPLRLHRSLLIARRSARPLSTVISSRSVCGKGGTSLYEGHPVIVDHMHAPRKTGIVQANNPSTTADEGASAAGPGSDVVAGHCVAWSPAIQTGINIDCELAFADRGGLIDACCCGGCLAVCCAHLSGERDTSSSERACLRDEMLY